MVLFLIPLQELLQEAVATKFANGISGVLGATGDAASRAWKILQIEARRLNKWRLIVMATTSSIKYSIEGIYKKNTYDSQFGEQGVGTGLDLGDAVPRH